MVKNDYKKILIWGANSKARIIQKMLENMGERASFLYDSYVDYPEFETNAQFSNSKKDLKKFIDQSTHFIVVIGGEYGMARYLISQQLIDSNLEPISVISESSTLDKTTKLGWGVQAMPGSIIHCYCEIGNAVIINTNSCIDHECFIGNGVHVMGSAAVAGRVRIEDFVTIGTNATILPHLTIEKGAFIGAGALVNKDVKENEVVIGNPARFLRKNEHIYNLDDFLE